MTSETSSSARSQKRQGFEDGSLEETKMGCITQAARLRVLHIVLFRLDRDPDCSGRC
ncbi:hypothetical protein CY34DRAFT_804059 [Suillus luteus UH-Slu-Lm8-n1]|uniref:Uncharacterized protein n=1 Tax=Suillus luteus UH-Slu-Lm8-n1 TaxID=930992 RepID=A0A0D0AMX9_9AGAM|nr:hypothetical protein CY34DRAFT_804059 [Suillus luteus UH-Slu-Lm8-n1]